jgi:presenilin-like A22 family membrane protease
MKHNVQVTAILVAAFLIIQVFGLFAISETTVVSVTPEGNVTVEYEDTVVGERPDIEGWVSLAYILFGVLVGTVLILIFVRLGQFKLWKMMYFLAIWLASSITLGVFVSAVVAFLAAFALAVLELYRTNIILHNLTELLIYPGIAILFVPLLNVFWASSLLLAISAYDVFAVWKSRHMVTLAKFQTKSRAFAGFVIPYGKGKGLKGFGSVRSRIPDEIGQKGGVRTAILGGGDIAFPLLFAGVVMDWLIKAAGLAKGAALAQSAIISVFAAIALLLLFIKAGKDKFYPAMPFISAGCFAGLAVVWLMNLPIVM